MPEIQLPTFHPGQIAAFQLPTKRKAIRCGRRWGKSMFGSAVACDGAAKGQSIGYFTPAYKYSIEIYNDVARILDPIWKGSSKVDGVYYTTTGGRVDFWTLEDERAGRSRKYHKIIIDEAAFAKPNMMNIWQQSIEPTLLDYSGSAIVLSNTNGEDPENFFWRICNEPEHGFTEYHAPSESNPTIPERLKNETDAEWQLRRAKIFADLRANRPPLVYAQEYDALFVSWAGVAFFAIDKWMGDDDLPIAMPNRCDITFATIDTAIKAGTEHDGTAVIYWAFNKYAGPGVGYPLVILDWDYVQIEGASLETWIPSVYERLKALTLGCGSRRGSLGAFVEDVGAGSVLIQACKRHGWPAQPVDSAFTALGKDEKGFNVSSYHYQSKVKITAEAHDKLVDFKGTSRNHLVSQVTGFRIGDKNAHKRADDLYDAYVAGLSLALGNFEGY